jgi:hypothetical protein
MLLGYGVKADHGDQYGGVWQSITHYDAYNRSEEYQRRSFDTYRLVFDDYEEHSYLLKMFSNGRAF